MPVLTPSTKAEVMEQTAMIREGLAVHDAECCTAEAPCNLRSGMQRVLTQLTETTAVAAPRIQGVVQPQTRRSQAGEGDGSFGPWNRDRSRLATDPQKSMIRKLAAAKNVTEYLGEDLETYLGHMLKTEVDGARSFMLGQPWPDRKPVAKKSDGPAEQGMYRTADGSIYRVQIAVHGSGRPYAKKLVDDGNGDWHFERVAGMVYKLAPAERMTLDEAKEWGKLYETCCVCAATLTDEKSIAAGIGPVCGDRV
jgi:hypothetical protein